MEEEIEIERRQHSNDMGRRRDDRVLRVLRNIEALTREDIDTNLGNTEFLRSIDASLKVIAANFQPVDTLESQVIIFGAAKNTT